MDKFDKNKQEYNRIMEENKKIIEKFNDSDIEKLDQIKFFNTLLASLYNESTFHIFDFVFNYAIRHKIKLFKHKEYQEWIIDIKSKEFKNKG